MRYKYAKGDKVIGLYYELMQLITEGKYYDVVEMVKINKWWFEKLPMNAKVQIRLLTRDGLNSKNQL